MKSEEDFRHAMVVSRLFKALTWVVVLLVNLAMILFTMLRGLQRGDHWQRVYLFACLLQFFVEIFFYETTECLLMNFFIPDLVRTEVLAVGFSIRQILQRVCSLSSAPSLTLPSTIGSTYQQQLALSQATALDVPNYLFVST
jgi:hypothetical protein